MFASSGRAQLAYDRFGGSADGTDVLLIHAGVTDRRSWAQLMARLVPRHRCVAYDQRRYGETEYVSEDGWSPVADAIAVMDAAGLPRPVIVGCSMGGMAALDIALAHPDRVGGLVLIAAGARGAPDVELDSEGPEAVIEAAMIAADQRHDLTELIALDARFWLDGPTAPEGRIGGEIRSLFIEMDRHAEEAPSPGEEVDLPSAWDRLEQIEVPTLVLTGRLDATPLLVRGPEMAERIPGAEFRWLEGVAHVPHMEGDPATLSAISTFIDSVAGR